MRTTVEQYRELFLFMKELEKIDPSWPAYVLKAHGYDPILVMKWLPNAKPLLDLAKKGGLENQKWIANSMDYILGLIRESDGAIPQPREDF